MRSATIHSKLSFGPFELSVGERLLRRDGEVLSMGGRAIDILIYLAERPGEVIAKHDLIDHVWPDVAVEEGSLRVHVAAIRKTLGDGQFGNRYIANIKGRGYSFVSTVVPVASNMENKNDNPTSQSRLPVRQPIIGRGTAVSDVGNKLRDERFVTLLGPGGIGKTTIAIAVGRAAAKEFGEKVHFVDLESLTDPSQVAGSVATSLGLALKSKDPGRELVDHVRSQKLLIILDSCEHVIDAVALIAEQLYQEAEQVHLLTTSRELLKVEGEHCYRIPALDFPMDSTEKTAGSVLRYSAVRLFAQRVAARAGGLALTDEEAPAVAEICRKLDGIPLAIELAAGQAAALGLKNTLDRLASRLEILSLSHRTAVLRHRTLRATLDWSYDLLSEVERVVLRRVAPFVGHFSLDAARSVADEVGAGAGEIFCAIAGLVEKSLISTQIDGAEWQYRLLETTRAYALEKLAECAEVNAVLRRHSEYLVEYFESRRAVRPAWSTSENRMAFGPSASMRQGPEWSLGPYRDSQIPADLAGVVSQFNELGNLRPALEWSFGPNGDDEIATRLAAASMPLFLELSLLTECRIWAERAIARLGDQEKNSRREMEICASLSLALMHTDGDNSERVRGAFSRALALAAVQGDLAYEVKLLNGLYIYNCLKIDVSSALETASQSKEAAMKTKDPDDLALAEAMLGGANYLAGNHLVALRNFESGLSILASGSHCRGGQEPIHHHSSLLLTGMARCSLYRGSVGHSVECANRAIDEGKKSEHPATLCRSLGLTLSVYLVLADFRRSEVHLAQLTELSEVHSVDPYRAVATGLRGQWHLLQNNFEEGIPLLRRALKELHTQRNETLAIDFLCELAAGLVAIGKRQEALTLILNAIDVQQRGRKFVYMSPLFRMKGIALAARSAEDFVEAEGSLRLAIDWAKHQSATLFELMAATDLAALLEKQARFPEGCKHIKEALDRMPAGITFPARERAFQVLSKFQSASKSLSRFGGPR